MYLKHFILFIFTTFALQAQIYNTKESSILQKSEAAVNPFFYSDFKEILRFEPLMFSNDDNMTSESKKYLNDKILETIKELNSSEEEYLITVVGHYERPTDDYYEKLADSQAYGREIYRLFEEETSSQTSFDKSEKYALIVKDKLVDEKVDENLITTEFRAGGDNAYTNENQDTKELSNRVLVSIYVKPTKARDSDRDGVVDIKDKCPNTPKGVKVDALGCPLDSDKDGVADYIDQCPDTLENVAVDAKGCPLDDDKDGVFNFQDKCPDTKPNLDVDTHGCPLKETLGLNFERGSFKILRDSYPKVVKFATFLNRNPIYDVTIIGHTDSRGSATKNMKLSQDRAEATKKALVSEGVEASRITTVGRGELEPIASNRVPDGRKVNRRIEIELKERAK